jgi:hypothetical protein
LKQLTDGLGEFNAVVSPDGKWVYYNAFTETRLKVERVSADGGQADDAARRSRLAQLPVEGGTSNLLNLPVAGVPSWAPDGKTISYVDFVDDQAVLMARDPDRGASRTLHSFGSNRLFGFAWSHDGRKIAFGQGTVSSDVVLITRK